MMDNIVYAYNALGQQIFMENQAGNVIETVYDDAGKTEHRKATTIQTGSGFDDAVKRITYAYDDHGRQETITQYDDATPGSGNVVNEVKFTYDEWDNIDTYEQDADSTIATGGNHLYDVTYSYEKATDGRNTLRRSSMTLPDGATVDFAYRSSTLDDDASRVTNMSLTPSGGSTLTTIVGYDYLGAGRVVGIDYPESDVMWEMFGSSSGSYPDLDRFNRITSSRWTKDLSTDIDFVDFDIFYDDNSNITRTEDNIYPAGFDVAYDLDGMNRLTDATEGTWDTMTEAITSKTREELYTLDQVGNFDVFQRDLDGDGSFTGTDEWDDDRTHNSVNELTARDIDDDGTNDYSLVYDAVGNMTDDGESYEFVYDVWGRLRKITTRGTSPRLVAEYEYYGNNYRASAHYDTDVDGDVDSNDKTYYFAYNERWQMMGVYRDTDSDPKEQFVYHLAGNSGYGGSSYIDQVVLRDRDDTNGWTGAADGTLEERIYYCQNWRYDVVALVTDTGELAERARYSPYGVPFGMPLGDVDGDGDVDGNDTNTISAGASGSDVKLDLDLDGDVDPADKTIASNNFGAAGGREVLSDIGNRKGYAAYEYAFIGESLYHVRNRVYDAELGRWTRRDPLGYVDGTNLFGYVNCRAVIAVDAYGLQKCSITLYCNPVQSSGSSGSIGQGGIYPIGLGDHCFLVFETGHQAEACRGEPQHGGRSGDNDQPDCTVDGRWGAINTFCGPYVPPEQLAPNPGGGLSDPHPDWPPGSPGVDVSSGPDACNLWDCIKREMDAIEHCCVPYDPFHVNSNSVISTALARCMKDGQVPDPPDPYGGTLRGPVGWDHEITDQDCTCPVTP